MRSLITTTIINKASLYRKSQKTTTRHNAEVKSCGETRHNGYIYITAPAPKFREHYIQGAERP